MLKKRAPLGIKARKSDDDSFTVAFSLHRGDEVIAGGGIDLRGVHHDSPEVAKVAGFDRYRRASTPLCTWLNLVGDLEGFFTSDLCRAH